MPLHRGKLVKPNTGTRPQRKRKSPLVECQEDLEMGVEGNKSRVDKMMKAEDTKIILRSHGLLKLKDGKVVPTPEMPSSYTVSDS